MCTVLDKDDQEAQSMLQIILEWRLCHVRLTQSPEQVPSSSWQEEWARPRFSKNLDWTVQNQTKKKIQDSQRAKWPERRNWREEELFPWSLWQAGSLKHKLKPQPNLQGEVKRLAPSLAKLHWNEWTAIIRHFTFTKESFSEQKKTELLMDVVDPKLHTWFKTRDSKLAASNLMIDLHKGCHGLGEKVISLQHQNIEAYRKDWVTRQ